MTNYYRKKKNYHYLAFILIVAAAVTELNAAADADASASHGTDEISQLNRYLDAYERATPELQWIESISRQIRDLRNRRDTWDDHQEAASHWQWQFSQYDGDDGDDSGDAWYNNFRKIECDGDETMKHCSSFVSSSILGADISGNIDPAERSAFKVVNNDAPKSTAGQVHNYYDEQPVKTEVPQNVAPVVAKVDAANLYYSPFISIVGSTSNSFEDVTADRSGRSTPDRRAHRELNDQRDLKKNDLSHEANYKLSKNEQEKKEPFTDDKVVMTKKSVITPAKEINLKISNRLMGKGLNPLLPSQTYESEAVKQQASTKSRRKRSVIKNLRSEKNPENIAKDERMSEDGGSVLAEEIKLVKRESK